AQPLPAAGPLGDPRRSHGRFPTGQGLPALAGPAAPLLRPVPRRRALHRSGRSMTINAVVFDYFGTLTPSVLKMITDAEHNALGAALGVDPDALEAQWRASFVARSTGRTGDLTTTLRMLATELGGTPTDAGLAEAARIRAAAYRRSAEPRPDSV